MLRIERPSTYRSPSSTSGSNPEIAALYTGVMAAAAATSTSMTATGMPGSEPISKPGAARSSKPTVITVRGGSRSASAVNSIPPRICGAKPMLNANAVRNADRVCA